MKKEIAISPIHNNHHTDETNIESTKMTSNQIQTDLRPHLISSIADSAKTNNTSNNRLLTPTSLNRNMKSKSSGRKLNNSNSYSLLTASKIKSENTSAYLENGKEITVKNYLIDLNMA